MASCIFQMEPYNNISLTFAGVSDSHVPAALLSREVITNTSFGSLQEEM